MSTIIYFLQRLLNITIFDIFTLLLLSFISYIILLAIKYPDNGVGTNYRKDVPGPKGVPIFGNLFSLMFKKKTYIELEQEWTDKYGSIYTFTIFKFARYLVSNDPQTLGYVFKTNCENYKRYPVFIETTHDLIGEGISLAEGPMWKFQRKLISQQLQGRNFQNIAYTSIIKRSEIMINILKKYADSGEPFDLKDLFFRFTLDTFGDLSFGVDFGCLTNTTNTDKDKFVASFEYIQTTTYERILQPFWKLIEKYSEKGQRIQEACKYSDDYIYNMINSHRSMLKIEKKSNNNMLTLLMDAVDDDGKKLDDKKLKDVLMNLIIAGRDTTALSLSWMMYEIMANQSIEALLLQEINSFLTTEKPIPSYNDIKLFKYTAATFYETLRLYPIVPVNGKVCIKNDVLPDNTPIFAGEYIEFNLYIMGRDEKIWGDDAKQFNPERFLDSKDSLNLDKSKFVPFSTGPRTCLGEQFSTLEVIILIIMLLKEFKFELASGQKLPPEFKDSMFLVMKDPLMTKVSYRTK